MAGITVKAGEGETLNVLGMPLRFLCDAHETGGAWSLMEEDIPIGHGPPPHRHDWDEAYYVISGALDFEMDGNPVRIEAGDFRLFAPEHSARLQGRIRVPRARAHLCSARSFIRVLQGCKSGGPHRA